MDIHRDSCIQLSDGNQLPVIGFGTYANINVPKHLCEEAIKVAIEVGYRHIDAAYYYCNEAEIGRAIQEKTADGTVKREDIFYTGKVWCTFLSPETVRPNLEKSLKALQMDYIDLYLLHWPVSLKAGEDLWPVDENGKLIYADVDFCRTWEVLEACRDAGLVKSIGVSNFNTRQLERILTNPGLKYRPVCNQVECHPYLTQKKLQMFCKTHNIAMVCYSILGTSNANYWTGRRMPILLEEPELLAIAEQHKRSPALIAIRYILQQGLVALVKSFYPERIKSNLEAFDFQLTPEDMNTLDGLNRNFHFWEVEGFKEHPEYPFKDD